MVDNIDPKKENSVEKYSNFMDTTNRNIDG